MRLMMRKRAMVAASVTAMTGALVMAIAAPAFAQNKSGKSTCAGGPTNYAGVKYSADTSQGGQIIFTNPSTYKNVIYDTGDYGNTASVYSPWNSTLWWVEAATVKSASSICYS